MNQSDVWIHVFDVCVTNIPLVNCLEFVKLQQLLPQLTLPHR